MATTAICNRKTTATSSSRTHPQHHDTRRHHDIRRDLPHPRRDSAPLQISDPTRVPAGGTGVRRLGCCNFQTRTDPDPQPRVLNDEALPWKSRSRRPHLLPHVAAPLPRNGITTAHSFPTSVFTSRCYSLLTTRQTRQAMSCLRPDWARREVDPSGSAGITADALKPFMAQTVREREQASWKSCSQHDHLPSLAAAPTTRNRNATARRSRRRCHGSCTHKAVTRALRQLARSQCIYPR